MRLEGKVAVITGAGSGMGRAMANLFAKEGAKVVAAEWNETTLAEIVDEVKTAGGEIVGIQGDVSVQADCEAIVDKAIEAFGRLDVLCNNAGVMDLNQGAVEMPNEMWERVLGINLNGPMYLTRKTIPAMKAAGGGSIVNTASLAGIAGGAAGLAYTVSKHGVLGLTKQTAFRYCPGGIRCNAIAAGAVETNTKQERSTCAGDTSRRDVGRRTGVDFSQSRSTNGRFGTLIRPHLARLNPRVRRAPGRSLIARHAG